MGKLPEDQAKWLRRIVAGEDAGRGPLNTTFLSQNTWRVLSELRFLGMVHGVIMLGSTPAGRQALSEHQGDADE